jgi:dGTPase
VRAPDQVVLAHGSSPLPLVGATRVTRTAREDAEQLLLAPGATRSAGAGDRAVPEEPDPLRTCFERDRDRILHSSAFRRLAGKTQVFVFPLDHQRTRLTHALEVAQVASAVARATGLNLALTEAIALGHDCGHGPGGHASEDAFSPYLPNGYNHALWGADVTLAPLNLCAETLDGVRHHSWCLPSPTTPEGALVSWADRCAYCAHDLEDAAGVGIVDIDDLPAAVTEVVGRTRAMQLHCFIGALVDCIVETGEIGMRQPYAGALAALREFNYERIYTRPRSIAQGQAVVAVLQGLVDYYAANPDTMPASLGRVGVGGAGGSRAGGGGAGASGAGASWTGAGESGVGQSGAGESGAGGNGTAPGDRPEAAAGAPGEAELAVRRAITYVSGMTDRFAFSTAVRLLGWPIERLPRGVDAPAAAL